jgi:hypothetical protein
METPPSQTSTPEAPPRKPLRWERPFLTALRLTGVVVRASDAAGVSRYAAYQHRDRHPDFAEAWAAAHAEGADRLEAEARRRAVDGTDEPVIHRGQPMGHWEDAGGNRLPQYAPGARFVPLTTKRYSDQLLALMLKAALPEKYRERADVSLTGPGGGAVEVVVKVLGPGLSLSDLLPPPGGDGP